MIYGLSTLQCVPRNIARIAIALLLALAASAPAQSAHPAATFNVIYNFTGGQDGQYPAAGLTLDSDGTHLYGTASAGGAASHGTVYRLTNHNGSWTFAPLYHFVGGIDGAQPEARVVFGPNGTLYGTTSTGGGATACPNGCGTVFDLQPPPTFPPTPFTPWLETVLYRFQGGADGAYPAYGDMAFGLTNQLYNTTSQGGNAGQCDGLGCGVLYALTPSGQGYTESVVYTFTNGADGGLPLDGPYFDGASRMFTVTTSSGGVHNAGTVDEINGMNGTETTVYAFNPATDGASPWAGVVPSRFGNVLYGVTSTGGPGNGGTVFALGDSLSVLYSFNFPSGGTVGPLRNLLLVYPSGNLYGVAYADGANSYGSVFVVGSEGFTDLHDFTGGADGALSAGQPRHRQQRTTSLRHCLWRRDAQFRRDLRDHAELRASR